MSTVHILKGGAGGNVRSLENAITKLGFTFKWVQSPEQISDVDKLMLPGVGHFGECVGELRKGGYLDAVRKHIDAGKPFMSICVGLQALFDGSDEDTTIPGLGLIPGQCRRFDNAEKSVPQIGWNSANASSKSLYGLQPQSKYYYVHSYQLPYDVELERQGWTVATGIYGGEKFVGAIARANVLATQFHPEKSGAAGLRVLRSFLTGEGAATVGQELTGPAPTGGLTRRVIACLDVRENDKGDLVVTKGDQYDVREKSSGGDVRNLGKPVDLAKRYYEQGADEVTFLNITSFRSLPLKDQPLLKVLEKTSEAVFVPLTIGGGIRDTTDPDGTKHSALEVAGQYFNSGADKVSIGSDAVLAAEAYQGRKAKGEPSCAGDTAIETISKAYGNQAVVVSVDPKRVYVADKEATKHTTMQTIYPGPNGENLCWYACTIKGGRETRDLDVIELVQAVQELGCGEILLNCIDRDGTNSGFDLELVRHVKKHVKIPVIASSGAGNPAHFEEVFRETPTDAALGAGIFHRGEYTVKQVKDHLAEKGMEVRQFEGDV